MVVAYRLSCSAACGIFPDQGSNQCALHWQADSYPLRHQGSPMMDFLRPLWGLPTPGFQQAEWWVGSENCWGFILLEILQGLQF